MHTDIFTSDWFKRSADFTHANTDTKLNWEGNLTSKFSSYLYGNTKANALVNSKSMLASELRTIASALGVKSHISVSIDSEAETSMTDGKSIIISNKFNEPAGDKYDLIDLIIGLLCHESAHCLYTDFNFVIDQNNIKTIDSLTKWIQNLIEDELIETKLGDKFPGYINFISQVKYYYFDKCCKEIIDSECKNELDFIMKLLLYIVRYPKYINTVNKNILNKYEDLFVKIKNILGDCSCLEAKYNDQITRLSLMAARRIYELLKDYIDNESGSGDANENGGDANNGHKAATGAEQSNNENQGNNNGGENSSESNAENGNSSGDTGNNKSFEEQKSEVLGDNNSVIAKTTKINAAYSSASESTKPYTYRKLVNEKKEKFDSETTTDMWGKGFLPLDKLGTDEAAASDIVKYEKAVMLMRPYISDCKKIFFNNDKTYRYENSRYQRNGNLDTTRFVDAMSRVNTIYTQRHQINAKQTPKFALVLTLDESGSMMYDGNHQKASNIAIMIAEAVKSFTGIELYIYGHGDDVVTYYNKKVHKLYSLANRKLQMEQNEEIAYTTIINDVRKQTQLPIVVINITDSAYLSNAADVKTVLTEYKKHNCSFNCICLQGYLISEAECSMNNELYGDDNWVAIHTTDDEVPVMINKLSQIVKRNYNKK